MIVINANIKTEAPSQLPCLLHKAPEKMHTATFP